MLTISNDTSPYSSVVVGLNGLGWFCPRKVAVGNTGCVTAVTAHGLSFTVVSAVFVITGELKSKKTLAELVIVVPSGSPGSWLIEYITYPWLLAGSCLLYTSPSPRDS